PDTTPTTCMICCFHGVEPTKYPVFKSCRLSPPIAAAQQTTAPMSSAAAGPSGALEPSTITRRSEASMSVAIVTPDTGLLELPTIPAMYPATVENRKAAVAITTVIRNATANVPTTHQYSTAISTTDKTISVTIQPKGASRSVRKTGSRPWSP